MRRKPALLPVVLFCIACTPAVAPVSGEWAGDLRHPAMTLPLEVTIDSAVAAARVSFRIWRLSAAPGQVVRRSDSLLITVPAAADTIRLQGTVRADVWTGTASRGKETGPFEVRHLEPLSGLEQGAIAGSYRTQDGNLIGIGMFTEFGERPMLVDYRSGRIGPVLPLSRDRWLVGHSIVAPIFPADTVEFTRGADGTVNGLRLRLAGLTTQTATRLATRDEEISFDNGPVRLGGTLTLPEGNGPHPAIVLVHGSKAQTRHSMGPWTRYFAGLGFAVLSFDKRGTGRSSGDWKQADFHVLASDVVAGVRTIRARKDIRADRIGLWGISQAGWIMPLVANAEPDAIAFLIVHAGTGTTVREQGILNYRNELRFAGLPDSAVEVGVRYRILDDSVTRTGRGFEMVRQFYQAHRAQAPWLEEPAPVDAWFRTYYRMLMDYDPAESWRQLTAPVLLFFGELDANVPPRESWPPIERGLSAARNGRVSHYVLPRANHVLLEARTGSRDEYPALTRFVSGYFDRMAEWLRPFAH